MSDILRIALLTGRLSPSAGGLAVSVPIMAHALGSFHDIDVHVMGITDPAYPNASGRWGESVTAFQSAQPVALQRSPEMFKSLINLNPDIVDVQGLWTWASYVSLKHWRKTSQPYVITPRGMLDPWARRNSWLKKQVFGSIIEFEHLKRAACLRATAELEAQHFRDFDLKNPIAIIPNAISIPELKPKVSQERRRVLFLSRIHKKKGIDFLLHAWRALQSEFPGWELIVAGLDEGGYEQRMKALAESLQLRRVSFPGAVFGVHKEALYRSSDLFVLPTHAENFGLVVAEALAQEVPVITTTNAPWIELTDRRCGWCIDLDQLTLTETMRRAMSQEPAHLHEMGRRGRVWMTDGFGIERVASSIREMYSWISGTGSKPNFVYS